MIIRGTTQVHYFEFPFAPQQITELSVIYNQNKQNVIRKTLSEVEFDEESLIVIFLEEIENGMIVYYFNDSGEIVSHQFGGDS